MHEGELAFEEQILMGSVSGTDQVQAQAILEDLSVGMDQIPRKLFGAGTFADPPVHGAE